MQRRHRRLAVILAAGALLSVAAGLTLFGLRSSVTYFYAPSDLAEAGDIGDRRIRLGGLVESGSVAREGAALRFAVTDGGARIAVRYQGDPPDLFRENQGVIAEGRLAADRASFEADKLLAKHDENYMPPEVAQALAERGAWRGPELEAPQP